MAAAQGEWSRVEEYYRERETILARHDLSPEVVARVCVLDQEIMERIRIAQAGLASLFNHTVHVRQRLKDLRQWNGARTSDSGTIARNM